MLKKIIIAALALLTVACKEKADQPLVDKSWQVTEQVQSEKLYFSGEIRPIRVAAVAASADAMVKEMKFQYGALVTKDQVLVVLSSEQQKKEYDDVLTQFLKAKDALDVAKAKFAGTEELWQAGLVSENSYKGDKSTLFSNRIAFLQAKLKLVQMAKKVKDIRADNVLNLSLNDFDKVRSLLEKNKSIILLRSPFDGIALLPESGSDKKEIREGSQIKNSEVITLIGDISGLSILIKVPEINIEKIKPGMKAVVTGVAFPGLSLDAKLESINAQANASSGAAGGLPIFSARVVIPKLTEAQKTAIKVGMSASVTINLSDKKRLMIPIEAVQQKQNKVVVKVKQKNGEVKEVEIKTGYSNGTEVAVESGLSVGETIVWQQRQ